jgi:imidazoleglycerol phosphate dehydratase HisB
VKGVVLDAAGYDDLARVLGDAFDQAASGKGAQRHADARPFGQQPMAAICDMVGPGFALGQAMKKAQESTRLPPQAARAELLGAIVYLAGAVLHLERKHGVNP